MTIAVFDADEHTEFAMDRGFQVDIVFGRHVECYRSAYAAAATGLLPEHDSF